MDSNLIIYIAIGSLVAVCIGGAVLRTSIDKKGDSQDRVLDAACATLIGMVGGTIWPVTLGFLFFMVAVTVIAVIGRKADSK